jgi:hypothetical protein
VKNFIMHTVTKQFSGDEVREDKMDETCSMKGEMRSSYISAGRPEG